MTGRKDMIHSDRQFMKEVGIKPCILDDPFPHPPKPAKPHESLIPSLAEKDACWLLNIKVKWEQEPEPGFVPPKSLREYLERYPNGIRDVVGGVAKELEFTLSDIDLDDLAQDIIVLFLDFSTDLEDIVGMYPRYPPMRRGGCKSVHFRDYIRLRVRAGVLTLLEERP